MNGQTGAVAAVAQGGPKGNRKMAREQLAPGEDCQAEAKLFTGIYKGHKRLKDLSHHATQRTTANVLNGGDG